MEWKSLALKIKLYGILFHLYSFRTAVQFVRQGLGSQVKYNHIVLSHNLEHLPQFWSVYGDCEIQHINWVWRLWNTPFQVCVVTFSLLYWVVVEVMIYLFCAFRFSETFAHVHTYTKCVCIHAQAHTHTHIYICAHTHTHNLQTYVLCFHMIRERKGWTGWGEGGGGGGGMIARLLHLWLI